MGTIKTGSSVHQSVCRHNEMGSLWMQLFLQFLTDLFETSQVFLSWSEDVHLVLGLSFRYFFINFFPLFRLSFFSRQITFRIDTDHLETMHTCSTWSEQACDFGVILLSSFSIFPLSFFPGSIRNIIYILWAQLLQEFYTDHLETMHSCSTWSEQACDFGVILLSTFSTFPLSFFSRFN